MRKILILTAAGVTLLAAGMLMIRGRDEGGKGLPENPVQLPSEKPEAASAPIEGSGVGSSGASATVIDRSDRGSDIAPRVATTFKDLPLKDQRYTEHQAVAEARLDADATINGVDARENDSVIFDHETGAVSELVLKSRVLLDADHPALGDDAWIIGPVLFFPGGEIYQLRVAQGQPLFGEAVPERTILNFDRDGNLTELTAIQDFVYRGRALQAGAVYRLDSAGNIIDR